MNGEAFARLRSPDPEETLLPMKTRCSVLALVLFAIFARVSPADEPLRRIAFGSCANQERPQPIWDAVRASQPELLLLLGDNIYADTNNMDVMRAKYAKLAAMPGFRALPRGLPDSRHLGRPRPRRQRWRQRLSQKGRVAEDLPGFLR